LHQSLSWAGTLLLAAAVVGAAQAQTTPPPATTTPAPAASAPQMVIQLSGKLDDPTMCADQLKGEAVSGTHLGYNMKEFNNLNYPIALGDYLEYEVLIPQSSTLHGGAVDGDTDVTPRVAGGPTIRDSYVAQDQNGLFAHPASSFDVLANRMISQTVNGQVQNVPLWQPGQWYKRDIDLSKLSLAADNTSQVMLTDLFVVIDEHDSTHLNDLCPVDPTNPNFTALFRNINIKNHDATGKQVVKMAIYNGEAKLPDGNTMDDIGEESGASGSVSVIAYTGPDTIAPASLVSFVPATATEPGATPVTNPTTPAGTTTGTTGGTTGATGTTGGTTGATTGGTTGATAGGTTGATTGGTTGATSGGTTGTTGGTTGDTTGGTTGTTGGSTGATGGTAAGAAGP